MCMSPKTSTTYRNPLAVSQPSTEPQFESALEGTLERRQFAPGECLFHEKDPSDGLYILRESMLIGAGAAVSGRPREYTARALTKVTADFVSREVIMSKMRAYLPFALQISQLLAADVERTNQFALRLRTGKMPA